MILSNKLNPFFKKEKNANNNSALITTGKEEVIC